MKVGLNHNGLLLANLFAALMCISISASASPRQFTAALVRSEEIRFTKFDDVIASIIDSDPIEQARFAEIAIELMVAAFSAELERLREDAGANGHDYSSWDLGTLQYVERLRNIAASLDPGSRLRIIKAPHSPIRLVIGSEQLMLSAPRLEDQATFERDIAEHVCRFSNCSRRGATVEERVEERTAMLDSGWVFGRSARPTYSSSDGLKCTFADRRHLKLKKEACLGLVHELRLLAEAFAALDVHRKLIDWPYLRIEHLGAGKAQKVIYNSMGDFMRMRLPRLLRTEAVWRGAIPWMKANLHGKVSHYVINLPDQLVYLTSTNESLL